MRQWRTLSALALAGATGLFSTVHVSASRSTSFAPWVVTPTALTSPLPSAPATAPGIISTAKHYLGAHYAYIGSSPKTGFSCIGFAHYVFAQSGINVPEDLTDAYATAPHVAQGDLQPGDLVFFKNTVWAGISHVDIYVSNGTMIGADSFKTGVTWDTLSDSYWQRHYLGATRPLSNPTGSSLEATMTPAPDFTTLPAATPTMTASTLPDAASIQMYSGPGRNYTLVATFSAATTLTVVRSQGTWLNVSYDNGNQLGWIERSNVTSTATSSPVATAAATASPTPAASVSLMKIHNSHSFLQSMTVPQNMHTQATDDNLVTVGTPVLFLRSGPGVQYSILGRLRAGRHLKLVESAVGWDHIQLASGQRGWVSAAWVY